MVDDADIAAVVKVLQSDFLTTGPAVREFEIGLEHATQASHARVLNSGTSALHAAYAAVGVGAGHEVITSPLTFAATANAALYLGARPVFVDVDEATGTIDVGLVEAAITPRTRVIVAVDYAGHPADYDALADIATRRGIRLVADAAHSLGAVYRGRRVGTLADATVLSFHPVKAITSGEGGAVLTEDADLAARVAEFRSHGVTSDPTRLRESDGPWHYEVQALGFNYRLTDIQAALGLSQLQKLDTFIDRRRQIAAEYDKAFDDLKQVRLPTRGQGVEPAWHLYVLRAVGGSVARRRLYDGLRAAGLGVQVHYMPVYLHPLYREAGFAPGQCPRAETFYQGAVSIPMFAGMTNADVERVIETVRDVAATI